MTNPAAIAPDSDAYYVKLFVDNPAWSAPAPNDDEAARWAKISGLLQAIAAQNPARRLRILDVGCGRGWLTNLASDFGDTEGVEPVAPVVEQARQLFPNLKFTAGTAETILASPDFRPYDLVVTSEVIEHVPRGEQPDFARKLARLLKPGGHVILTTPRGESLREWTRLTGDPSQPVEDWLREPELRELFTRAQFTVAGHQRVLFDTETRRYVSDEEAQSSENLLAIYQVWAFQFFANAAAATARDLADDDHTATTSPPSPREERTGRGPGRGATQEQPNATRTPSLADSTREQVAAPFMGTSREPLPPALAEFHRDCAAAAERALVSLPDHPALLTARAAALLAVGEVEAARRSLAWTVALHADHAPARKLFAEVLRRLGHFAAAEAQADRAAEIESAQNGSAGKSFSFLNHLDKGALLAGAPTQLERRHAAIAGRAAPCIYLHPPARLRFEVPATGPGVFTCAIAIQPDAWDKPTAGGCEFFLTVNGREVFRKAIDPRHNPAHRCWHEIEIEVPAVSGRAHEFIFRTQAVGSPPDFRWALWREPVFRPHPAPAAKPL